MEVISNFFYRDRPYTLLWNDYESELITSFGRLLDNDMFTDCVLVVEGTAIRVHRLVLAACSPYFESLFQNEYRDQFPRIKLNHLTYAEAVALIDYMYDGAVTLPGGQVESFRKAAASLQIKTMTRNEFNVFRSNRNSNSNSTENSTPQQHDVVSSTVPDVETPGRRPAAVAGGSVASPSHTIPIVDLDRTPNPAASDLAGEGPKPADKNTNGALRKRRKRRRVTGNGSKTGRDGTTGVIKLRKTEIVEKNRSICYNVRNATGEGKLAVENTISTLRELGKRYGTNNGSETEDKGYKYRRREGTTDGIQFGKTETVDENRSSSYNIQNNTGTTNTAVVSSTTSSQITNNIRLEKSMENTERGGTNTPSNMEDQGWKLDIRKQ